MLGYETQYINPTRMCPIFLSIYLFVLWWSTLGGVLIKSAFFAAGKEEECVCVCVFVCVCCVANVCVCVCVCLCVCLHPVCVCMCVSI